MKRLHIGASRLERLVPQTIELMSDPSWTHLGEPEISWENRLANEWKFHNWSNCIRLVYRNIRPRYTKEQLKKFYAKTDFREFNYKPGNKFEFEDNTFDFIFSEHFLEHLFFDEAIEFLKECYRILKPNGVIRIVVPDADLRTYDKIEPPGFPNNNIPWSDPDKHKTRWSIYSLSPAIEQGGLMARPIMYCDKYGKFFSLTPLESDLEYRLSQDKQFVFSLNYIRRLPSLICDGVKVDHQS